MNFFPYSTEVMEGRRVPSISSIPSLNVTGQRMMKGRLRPSASQINPISRFRRSSSSFALNGSAGSTDTHTKFRSPSCWTWSITSYHCFCFPASFAAGNEINIVLTIPTPGPHEGDYALPIFTESDLDSCSFGVYSYGRPWLNSDSCSDPV